ncbi:MAG: outer membrane protein assembly factor [Moraxellaceae bacterium]|nr:outer membrane protein assembly factor [Pseudomonadales bacterium]MCB1674083.1 outer membrane protein assembly factor [Pseudomonadales bacterium]MCP5174013.1 outer membrane protein assembly factor [Moraxellaceae bacterium]
MWLRVSAWLCLGLTLAPYTMAADKNRFSELEAYINQFTKPSDKVPIKIKGVSTDIKANIEAYIGDLNKDDLTQWRETSARLRKATREALESLGYYQAEFKFNRLEKALELEVQLNQPVIVDSVKLSYVGQAGNDIAFTALRETFPLKEGDVLHHGRYEAAKSLLQNMALERGYFDGQWLKHEVLIDKDTQKAQVNLQYDSGERYKLGEVSFKHTRANQQLAIDADLLDNLVPFKAGDDYEAEKVIKLNKVLLDSRYFNEVKVRAESGLAQDYVVPVNVLLAMDSPNQVDLGAGYATDIGARVSATWRRSLLNRRGHSIETSSEISQVRQSATARYGIPWTHPINDTLQILAGFKREDIDEIAITNNSVLGVERQKKRDSGWQTTESLRWSRESYRQENGEKGRSDLLLPSYSISRVRTKGSKTDPERGDRQSYQVELASSSVLSDADLIALQANWRWLNTFAQRHQLLLRADVGTIISSDFDSVPLNIRFYAGGDQSVRGYDYKSLSPRDSTGQVTGASNLVALSSEYAFKLTSKWRLAAFVDAGNAFDAASDGLKVGVGGGIRWISPVGPIRLDIAQSLDNGNASPRIHFFMGPAL